MRASGKALHEIFFAEVKVRQSSRFRDLCCQVLKEAVEYPDRLANLGSPFCSLAMDPQRKLGPGRSYSRQITLSPERMRFAIATAGPITCSMLEYRYSPMGPPVNDQYLTESICQQSRNKRFRLAPCRQGSLPTALAMHLKTGLRRTEFAVEHIVKTSSGFGGEASQFTWE